MDQDAYQYAELVALLKEEGHSAETIDAILEQVKEYEKKTGIDSVMDSIANGTFDLDAVITDALRSIGKDDSYSE
ncbi:MAG: hypothetical protein ACFCD0_12900 [Gemmataceae bacterium]